MFGSPYDYPYPSQRRQVYAGKGMIAASSPLAVQAGIRMFAEGGNAIDAALAAAAALSIVEPCSCGPGGDCFAIIHSGGQMYGMNSAGRSPALFTYDEVIRQGYDKMPDLGWLPVTVPGAPAGWVSLSKRFGRLPLNVVFEPAIELSKGHPLALQPALGIKLMKEDLEKNRAKFPETSTWFDVWTPTNTAPSPGDIIAPTELGETLRLIAQTDGAEFYEGEIAHALEKCAVETGGFIRANDLKQHEVHYVQPISINYKGIDVWELPPSGQGIAALLALNIVKQMNPVSRDDVDTLHFQMEAMKLAFADVAEYIADPSYMRVSVEGLLKESYAATRAALIDPARAQTHLFGTPPKGDTSYFCCADEEGNMISMIQSLFNHFGSGVLVPGTGMVLQNRGSCFTIRRDHPNAPAPLKYPYHTIIPGFLTKDGNPLGPFGVMGGYMQPQGHLQVVTNMIDFGLNPQSALDAPRWCWQNDNRIAMEPTWDPSIINALREKGHDINIDDSFIYGRGQIILRMDNGVLVGASEMRADGMAIGL